MEVKTADAGMRLDVKQKAEEILARLGIPCSVAIDMYYRQIIAHNGIPFSLTLPAAVVARDEMTAAQFSQMMSAGLKQAREDDSFGLDEVFDELEREDDV